jgi:hypothetical protein
MSQTGAITVSETDIKKAAQFRFDSDRFAAKCVAAKNGKRIMFVLPW